MDKPSPTGIFPRLHIRNRVGDALWNDPTIQCSFQLSANPQRNGHVSHLPAVESPMRFEKTAGAAPERVDIASQPTVAALACAKADSSLIFAHGHKGNLDSSRVPITANQLARREFPSPRRLRSS